jgi:hypothetical protein
LCVTALAKPLEAQQNAVTNQYQVVLFPHYPVKGALSGFSEFSYANDPDGRFSSVYGEFPGFTYGPKKWLQLWTGFRVTYTNNEVKSDTLELRPFVGVKFFFAGTNRVNLYNYTRYEYRSTYTHGMAKWSHNSRIRSRFGIEIPLASAERVWKPKTFYALVDAEAFYQFNDSNWNQVRLRAGLGYVTHDRVRIEFTYGAQFGRSAPDADLLYNRNLFRLEIRVGLKRGLLARIWNPRQAPPAD